MRRILLVDGHSMIFASRELRELHGRIPSAARDELLRWVRVLHDCGEWTLGIVFDGRGGQATEENEGVGPAVFYSRSGQTADSLIERLVAKYAQTFEVVVATEDLAERRTVEALGGRGLGFQGLDEEIRRVRAALDEAARAGSQPERAFTRGRS